MCTFLKEREPSKMAVSWSPVTSLRPAINSDFRRCLDIETWVHMSGSLSANPKVVS